LPRDEGCHGRFAAVVEERPNHFGAFSADTARKAFRSNACGKRYLQAPPDIRYVRILGSDSGGEAFKDKSAHLIGEGQFALQHLSVNAAHFQVDGDRRAG
jgi:hypothetical protein